MFQTRKLDNLSDWLLESSDKVAAIQADSLTFQFRRAYCHRLPFASLTTGSKGVGKKLPLFAKVEPKLASQQAKTKNFRVVKVAADGRCMFRALAKGLAYNQGMYLTGPSETEDADELRMAVFEAICAKKNRQHEFKDALLSIKSEYTIEQYCEHIRHAGFWGGESEMIVLSKMLKVPVVVYLSAKDARKSGRGYSRLVTYGSDFLTKRKPVRLLYSGGNHYDLLLPA